MVNRRASGAIPPETPIAPVVKRKRRASRLGEQERRERKRAIDREAQRSLREKTKTHIADLERTIQILRDQDHNGATASLLSEIETLRTENERLREVIENVKNVVGGRLFTQNPAPANPSNGAAAENSPVTSSVGQRSPKPRTVSFTYDTKPSLPTPTEIPTTFTFHEHTPASIRQLDLDGMTVMTDMEAPVAPGPTLEMNLELEIVVESPEEAEDVEELPWGNDPATATWAPMMAEIFGPNWRCPSPVILHIGEPDPPKGTISGPTCPVWRRSNELFGKIFSYRGNSSSTHCVEAGLLFQGIKDGWNAVSNTAMQSSPALTILRQVDELLFARLPSTERLAVLYKSLKLLKYYLNATNEELENVPRWLRPSPSQSSTTQPIAIDFFAWPTLRARLMSNHASIFRTGDLSRAYPRFLRFDWPFSFEDTFYYDSGAGGMRDEDGSTGGYIPTPLWERYHNDLQYWTVDPAFYEKLPEMRGDIEGDRKVWADE